MLTRLAEETPTRVSNNRLLGFLAIRDQAFASTPDAVIAFVIAMIILNHILPDETKRELIRSNDLGELRLYAKERLGDWHVERMFEELEKYSRPFAPITERLSPSLELVITRD